MKKFKDFVKDKQQQPTPEDKKKRQENGHLGWKTSDVEFEHTPEPIKEDAWNQDAWNHRYKGNYSGAYHGGLKHPYSDLDKKFAAKKTAAANSKPYFSNHPDQLKLFKDKKLPKLTVGTHDNPAKVNYNDIQMHHTHEEATKAFEKHGMNLENHHRDSIKGYKSSSYEINTDLRHSKGRTPGRDRKVFQRHLDHVTSGTTTQHMTVYRGIHDREFYNKPVGTKFTDHGYTGTTLNPDIARDFAKDYPKTGLFRIHVPQGSKAHYFDMHNNNHQHEREMVIHRGTQYKIMKHSVDERGNRVIDLHVVGQRGGTKK